MMPNNNMQFQKSVGGSKAFLRTRKGRVEDEQRVYKEEHQWRCESREGDRRRECTTLISLQHN